MRDGRGCCGGGGAGGYLERLAAGEERREGGGMGAAGAVSCGNRVAGDGDLDVVRAVEEVVDGMLAMAAGDEDGGRLRARAASRRDPGAGR